MVGIDLKQTLLPGDGTANRFGPGFAWRWRSRTHRTDDRLAFAWRFSSYSTAVSVPLSGADFSVGDVRIRPLLAGLDYKMPRGRWTWSAGVSAGIGFNGMHTPDETRLGLANTLGGAVQTDVHNSLVISPRVKGWYDFNRRVSLVVEAAYNYARPELTIRGPNGDFSRRLTADALIVKTGVLYGIW